MRDGLHHKAFLCIAGLLLCFWVRPAEAARSFAVTQTPASADLSMGTAQPISFTISNTSTAGETLTSVQFNVSGTYTYIPPQTITMTGWTCSLSRSTGSNYRRITCSANSSGYRIAPGSSNTYSFSLINNTANSSTDRTDMLSSVVASFWTGGRTRTSSLFNQGAWTWKALFMTMVPSSLSVGNGCTFTLTMTVTNRSTANLTNITAVAKPPARIYTGGASVATPSNPANLSLNAGATGTLAWTFTLTGPVGSTVRFSACASTGASCTTTSGTTRTSGSITSSAVAVAPGLSCGLAATITNNPACLYSGSIATFVMTVVNTTGAAVANVAPSALTRIVTGAAAIGTFSPLTQTPIASIPNNGTGTFTWTAPVTGIANDQYSVSGYATANGPLQSTTVASNVQDVDGYIVSAGSSNAESTNEELTWTITSYACSNINQVSIAIPGGWTFANEAYSVVNNMAGNPVETWTVAGTTFTSPSAADRIPPAPAALNSGSFSLVFSQTPTTPGDYVFDVTIVDDATPPVTRVKPTTVTVSPFNAGPGGPNAAGTAVWHEDVP